MSRQDVPRDSFALARSLRMTCRLIRSVYIIPMLVFVTSVLNGASMSDTCVSFTDSDKDPADKKVLKMLDARDVDVYRTDTLGTIMVSNDSSGNYSVSK